MNAKPSTPKPGASRADTPNAKMVYEVSRRDLPLHCPTPEMSLWNSHPQVYLPIEDSGEASCPYCGARYVLKD
ncbi:MAG: zinc-finger domain-containing protein [Chromatiales bacterium]|nr:zinc-finger domain-containing protein [Chromatiales bacterium]